MADPIKAVIFDLDGVLVDTAGYHYIAWSQLAEELGIPFTETDNERLKGVSRVHCMEILLSMGQVQLSEEQKLQAMQKKNQNYVQMIQRMTAEHILPGALEFLKELRIAGICTALGSASKNAGTILECTGLGQYLDCIVDGTATSAAKPDPEVFLLGAQGLAIEPRYCVVFEDAQAGIEAAQRAQMRSVGVGSAEQLGGAGLVIPSMQDIHWEKLQQALA